MLLAGLTRITRIGPYVEGVALHAGERPGGTARISKQMRLIELRKIIVTTDPELVTSDSDDGHTHRRPMGRNFLRVR